MLSRFHGIPERTDRQTDGQTIAIYNVRQCADCWRAIKLSSFTLWLCNSATATRVVTCTVKHYTNQHWANISDDKMELKKDNAASVILPYPGKGGCGRILRDLPESATARIHSWKRINTKSEPFLKHQPLSMGTKFRRHSSTRYVANSPSHRHTHTHTGNHNTFSSSIQKLSLRIATNTKQKI